MPTQSTANRVNDAPVDGRCDFDFFFGSWDVSHRRLQRRLAGDGNWDVFGGTCAVRPLLGGLGNVDDNVIELPGGAYRAATVRTFDPATRQWSIWWIDGRNPLTIDVPMRGNPALLFLAAGVYLVVALAIGLWISTLVETQQQAMFVTFFVLMIYLLMSGLFTPVESMPEWVQVASLLNPVRHFVTISRAILIKGAGVSEIATPLGVLAVYGVVVLGLAIRQYNKTAA